MKPRQIPAFSLEEFCHLYSTRDLLAEHPCVVEGFVPQWPAFAKWQSLDYLQEVFGRHAVMAAAPQFQSAVGKTACRVRTTFGRYLQYLQAPEQARALFEGCWEEGDFETFQAQGIPLYCGNLRFAKGPDDPVLADLQPLLPAPVECWNSYIPFFYQTYTHFWLYVSNAGALTPLHEDNNAVCAYLGQLKGEKEAILFSPDDLPHVHSPESGWVDPLRPDRDRFPTFDEAQPWEGTLRPGQLLIWGGRWAHHVRTTADSITTSFDWINGSNIQAFVRKRDWLATLGQYASVYRSRLPIPLPAGVEGWQLGKAAVTFLLERRLEHLGEGLERSVVSRLLALVAQEV